MLLRLFTILVLSYLVFSAANCRKDSRFNIVLILIDQLRADRLGFDGSKLGLSPKLDAIARKGFYFSAARSAAPWTWPSVCSLHTGLYPRTHGANRLKSLKPGGPRISALSLKLKTLAEYLQEDGYRTAAFVANPYLKPEGKFNQGFDHYEHEFVKPWLKSDPRWWQKGSYSDTLDPQILKYVHNQKRRPQFLYIHFIDVHGPWDYAPFVTEEERAELAQQTVPNPELDQALYHRSIEYLDRNLGSLIEGLKKEFQGNVLFVITADHGRSLAPQDSSNRWKLNKASLHEFNLRIPLIFYGPESKPFQGNSDAEVSLVDILPTFLEMIGSRQGSTPPLQGISLLPALHGKKLADRKLYAEVNDYSADQKAVMEAMMSHRTKLIRATAPLSASFRYNLVEDPLELAPPLDEAKSTNDPAFLVLQKAFATFGQKAFQQEAVPLEEETAEQLRSLGYTQ